MADCSAPNGPIRLKFYVVDGLGYGYKQCEFRGDASRYVSAAVEKQSKNRVAPVSTVCSLAPEILTSFSVKIFGGAKFMNHQVLYIKKNLRHSAITTSKDIKIGQPGPELRGVSKITRTFGHPVEPW